MNCKLSEAEQLSEAAAVAELLERWADALPRGRVQGSERWDVYLERRYEADMALAKRLRGLPTCQLSMCPMREEVTLILAGVRVRTDRGLADACRKWAHAVRARV